jgi:CDP-diacylglycerol--serine O-phosphatidyltransferase
MTIVFKMNQDARKRPRRKRLRLIPVLPTMLTLGNLLCGFAAIHFALRAMYAAGAGEDPAIQWTLDNQRIERLLPSFFAIGAVLIFVGMIFDLLDGFAARLTNMTSEFGAQVDSLADVVTFGVAPAILVIALMLQAWSPEQVIITPHSEQLIGRLMWVCAAVYTLCAAVRLARFNVEQGQVDVSNRSFRGLPSPGAAAVVASLITLHEQTPTIANAVLLCLPVVTLICGMLMVSRIRYERLTHSYLIRHRPFDIVVFLAFKAETLAVLCVGYALSGPVMSIVRRLRARPSPIPAQLAPKSDNNSDSTKNAAN